MATFVLVHGGWDGGWAWRAVADELRAAGHTVFTPTLTGSGERVHLASPDIDLHTHIQDIVHMLVYEDLRDVVLVASSSGGMVITGVAERVPERLGQLIYLDAFVPRDGETLLAIVGPELAHEFVAAAQAYGDGWRVPHNPPGADRRTDSLLRCAQTPVSVSNPAAARLKHTYIHCTAKAPDDFLKPIMERMAARAHDQGELPLPHWPLLDAPHQVAQELLALAEGAATTSRASPQPDGTDFLRSAMEEVRMSTYYGDVDDQYLQLLAKLLEQTKQRSYELMHIQPGARVLDVGCGTGMDTIALGQLVGPSGQVVGVDVDRAFLALADQRAAEAGVQVWVSHREADATRLPFADGRFDACRCERLLQHLAEPEQAVSEMVRVTRPGGAIVVLDPDWSTLSIDTPEVEIGRRLVRFEVDAHRSGFSGRQLYRFLRRQQLVDLVVEAVATYYTSYVMADQVLGLAEQAQEAARQGAINEDEAQRWLASLARAGAEGVFFATLTGTMIGARKPA